MALTSYQTQTQRLLQNPGAPTTLYSTTDLNSWINTARGQIAAEGRCIRRLGSLATIVGVTAYDFTSISISDLNVAGVINVRSMLYSVGQPGLGFQFVDLHSWEWYQLYYMNDPAPTEGPPNVWAQFGQGSTPVGIGSGGISASGGSIYISPPPDKVYTLTLDCVCYPITLINDTTEEALPYLWTDCVPFFAAWYALLSSQMQARQQDAERYFGYYQTFMQRARNAANPDVNTFNFEQASDVTRLNKLGVQPRGGNAVAQ